MIDFEEYPKIARLNRDVIISEKIDGTNAQILIGQDGSMRCGSRNRWIDVGDDNAGFAYWVWQHTEELRELGPGRHFGEWWGQGIQRKYGQDRKRWSLFNVGRWAESRPPCCDLVPVLYRGNFDTGAVRNCLELLRTQGSSAAPGFMDPEGVVVWHTQGNIGFKVTLKNDDKGKSYGS